MTARDSSTNRQASGHAARASHPLMRSIEPGEDWSWRAVDEAGFVLSR